MSKTAKKEAPQSININGKDYLVDSLPDQTKQLLVIHSKWQADIQALELKSKEAQLDLLMAQTAVRSISDEIIRSVPQPVEPTPVDPAGEGDTPKVDPEVVVSPE